MQKPVCYGTLISVKIPSFHDAERRLTRSPFSSELPDLSNAPHGKLSLMASALVHRLSHIFPRWLDQHLANEWDLNGPRLMLVALLNKAESLTMSEAAEMLDVTPRAITRLVDGLEADGLVARQVSEKDKRVIQITVTASAQDKVKQLLPRHEARMAELFEEFSADELRQYVQLSNKLARRLKQLEAED